MFTKGPSTSRNSLKIIVQKMLLKTFLTLIYITTQLVCRLKKALMLKGMVSQPLRVETPNWWMDRCFWNDPLNYRIMDRLISQKNVSLMPIEQRPLMSFTITNNLLALSIKATDLRISPHATITTTWNNAENLEDGSYGMKHLEICS